MRTLRTVSMSVAALAMLAVPAGAEKLAGVTMPDTVNAGGRQLVLNGLGLREATALKIDVYVAGLYLEQQASDPAEILGSDQVKRLNLAFVRDVDRGDITDAWSEGFRNNAGDRIPALQGRIDQLNSWMPDLKRGDTLTFTYLPGTGTVVHVNGQREGVIEGDDFARALFSIWLGEKPPNKGLKKGLLGRR
jgi:hypothetical protein